MGYRAGIGQALMASTNKHITVSGPYIFCDMCQTHRSISPKNSFKPYVWFLNGKKAPGWSGGRVKGEHTRIDYCGECAKERLEKK